ncbi:MAG: family 16 glycosylhydrolase [Rikenellaceae bacterium]
MSQIDATVSCDQATNIVTFTLNSTDLTPKWYFEDGTNSTETIVERLYPIAGDYQVDVKVMNKYGMSEEAKIYKFTVDNDYNGEKYELVWSDEFDGDALDQSVWHLEQGYLANNELQDYKTSGNHEVSNGSLKIIAKKVNDNKEFGSYTSARIISYYGGKSFTYGRIESRIKIPSGVGTWPAFWMLGDSLMEGGSWPSCGEIDIMEHVGYESEKIHATIHYNNSSGSYTSQTGSITIDSEDEWLIYGVIWTADGLQFYIDDPDNIYANYSAPATKTNWPFDEPQFLILNLAIGGDWGGAQGIDNTIFDATGSIQMEVDYVRVYDILY